MICEICNIEIEEASICPICNKEVEIDFSKFVDWVTVYETNDIFEAEMLKSNLVSAELPVVVLSQQDSSRMLTVGQLGLIKLLAPLQYSIEVSNYIYLMLKGDETQ